MVETIGRLMFYEYGANVTDDQISALKSSLEVLRGISGVVSAEIVELKRHLVPDTSKPSATLDNSLVVKLESLKAAKEYGPNSVHKKWAQEVFGPLRREDTAIYFPHSIFERLVEAPKEEHFRLFSMFEGSGGDERFSQYVRELRQIEGVSVVPITRMDDLVSPNLKMRAKYTDGLIVRPQSLEAANAYRSIDDRMYSTNIAPLIEQDKGSLYFAHRTAK